MDRIMETSNEFEDMIVQSERTNQMLEIKKLNEIIKVLISALRYERGVNATIDYIDRLPDFQIKESDINKICLFIEKKFKKENKKC